MTLSVQTKEIAPEGSKPVLAEIEKAFGFIPNLSGVLSNSPLALTGNE